MMVPIETLDGRRGLVAWQAGALPTISQGDLTDAEVDAVREVLVAEHEFRTADADPDKRDGGGVATSRWADSVEAAAWALSNLPGTVLVMPVWGESEGAPLG